MGRVERIDPARMPVGARRDSRVAAPAVGVDARHYAVIAVLEADIERVDLVGRGQRLVEDVAALLAAEEAGLGAGHRGDQAQCRADRRQEVRGGGDRFVARPVDEAIGQRAQVAGVLVIAEGDDEPERGQDQQHEDRRDANLKTDLPPPAQHRAI